MITIDAKDKTLGRVASAAAKALLGKHSADFAKNVVAQDGVTVINASRVKVTGAKNRDKEYIRYSGYPGGLRYETLAQVLEKKGIEEVLRRAVYGMLPGNKLRPEIMKNLTVTE